MGVHHAQTSHHARRGLRGDAVLRADSARRQPALRGHADRDPQRRLAHDLRKEAGLGSETQVSIQVSAEAACLNPGEQFPQAANKETFTAEGTFPVQNGKALFELTLTATFQPKCSPPMTVVFGDVTVQDIEHGLSVTIPGPF